MRRTTLLAVVALVLIGGPPGASQTTMQTARDEGRALADEKRHDATLIPSDEASARQVPGYTGNTTPQSAYFDDPDRLVADAAAQATVHDGFRAATDPDRRRPTFSASELRAATVRGTAVAADPATYLAGESVGARGASCVPLPPGSTEAGWYEATCSAGTAVEESNPVCRAPLVVEVRSEQRWRYRCETVSNPARPSIRRQCGVFEPLVENGSCREISRVVTGRECLQGVWPDCTEPGDPIEEVTLSCRDPVPGHSGTLVEETAIAGERADQTQCEAATAGATCQQTSETCVDIEPATRMIGGLSVTRACWAWERRYSCGRFSQANSCGDLEANRQCTFLRTDCLDDPPAGPCKVAEKVYRCPVPSGGGPAERQYICGSDVYCLNGDCEPIVREASTEFRDALVGLHALGQAGQEFDADNFTVFSGTRDTCHRPVFGLVNCCAGRTSGLLTVAAGGAALAGGPAAIAALATPFLSTFLCSQDEMRLDIKDRMGFCHPVGTFCSASVLGICTTKRTAYCCFESKLSRILQEQGRAQLSKPWDTPKREQCRGFTVDEFARLDLSRMDFTEIYADFLEAAKLPNEVQTVADLQAKIGAYFALHSRSRR